MLTKCLPTSRLSRGSYGTLLGTMAGTLVGAGLFGVAEAGFLHDVYAFETHPRKLKPWGVWALVGAIAAGGAIGGVLTSRTPQCRY